MAPFHSKFEKWNSFPVELKSECIKWMDLKTRFRLSSTCHTERRLVHDVKFRWDELDITENIMRRNNYMLVMKYGKNHSYRFQHPDDETVFDLLAFILKTVRIDNFWCSQKDSDIFDLFSRFDESSIHHISSYYGCVDFRRLEFLRKLGPGTVRKMKFSWTDEDLTRFPMAEFLQYPMINSIKSWDVELDELSPTMAQLFIRKMIEIDVDVGSKMEIDIPEWTSMQDFVGGMRDLKILETTDTIIRIEMNDVEKHLILRCKISITGRFTDCECIGRVVESDFAASEYGNIKRN